MVNRIRQTLRQGIRALAVPLNRFTGGKLTPNMVTWFGMGMHIPIAALIATNHTVWAAMLLIFFGLFDTLDGELARLQNRVSDQGGFLDATTDRFKEVVLYTGVGLLLASGSHPRNAAIAVIACGASICVSYVRAKGETIFATQDKRKKYTDLNKLFRGGLAPFEIRMAVLAAGLLFSQVALATAVIAVLASFAALQRLIDISRALRA